MFLNTPWHVVCCKAGHLVARRSNAYYAVKVWGLSVCPMGGWPCGAPGLDTRLEKPFPWPKISQRSEIEGTWIAG